MIVLNCVVVDPDKEAAKRQIVLPSGIKSSKHENIVVCECVVHEISNYDFVFN
jgi:hypothetical protein